MAMGTRAFVEKLPFVTSLGHGSGPGSREALGVTTKGPTQGHHRPLPDGAGPGDARADGDGALSGRDGARRSQAECGWPLKFAPASHEIAAADGDRARRAARAAGAHGARARKRAEPMRDVFICEPVRTPIGRYGGALAKVRTDDLAAIPIRALIERHPGLTEPRRRGLSRLRQPGRRGQPQRRAHGAAARRPAGFDARRDAEPPLRLRPRRRRRRGARRSSAGDIELAIAGGVESMSRAPFVMGKAEQAFQRTAEIYDTTIGWRFINPLMKAAIRRRFHAGDRRERGGGIPGEPRRPGRLRAALAAARRPRPGGEAASPRRSSPVEVPGGKAGPTMVDKRRASARRHDGSRRSPS